MLEKLGYRPNDRLVIIHADDFGISGPVNRAVMDLFDAGAITSASLMTPCEAAPEAAGYSSRNPSASR